MRHAGGPDPTLLVAAGEILLIVKEPVNAEKIFNRAIRAGAENWRAHLGLGPSALMRADWNAAARSMWTARDLAPAGCKRAISAAIADLQRITATR